MKIGIVTRSMPAEYTNRQAAEAMAAMGFTSTELCFTQSDSNYWCYNGSTDLSGLTPSGKGDCRHLPGQGHPGHCSGRLYQPH